LIVLVAFVSLSLPTTAAAQDQPYFSLAFGPAILREQGPGGFEPSLYGNGAVLAGTYRIGQSQLWGAGEFGRNSRRNSVGETATLTSFLGGAMVQLVRAPRWTLFAQALVGVERFREPGLSESGLAIQPGGGIDFRFGSRWLVRGQVDYRLSRQDVTFHDIRAFAGIGILLSR
jgi:hypothetical protein